MNKQVERLGSILSPNTVWFLLPPSLVVVLVNTTT